MNSCSIPLVATKKTWFSALQLLDRPTQSSFIIQNKVLAVSVIFLEIDFSCVEKFAQRPCLWATVPFVFSLCCPSLHTIILTAYLQRSASWILTSCCTCCRMHFMNQFRSFCLALEHKKIQVTPCLVHTNLI